MPKLPFHRHIELGNLVDNSIPIEEDDHIVTLYNIRYDNATSIQDSVNFVTSCN